VDVASWRTCRQVLIPALGLTTIDEVEELYGTYYPGDELTTRTAQIIQAVLDSDPPRPETVELPYLDH
jgi:hypothetical protein